MVKLKENTNNGVVLSSLQKKMMAAVTLPLSPDCPTALRYALAKYDAGAVAEAYAGLLALSRQGFLMNVSQ